MTCPTKHKRANDQSATCFFSSLIHDPINVFNVHLSHFKFFPNFKNITYQTWGLCEQEGCPYVQVGVAQNVHCCTSLNQPMEAEICCPEKIQKKAL